MPAKAGIQNWDSSDLYLSFKRIASSLRAFLTVFGVIFVITIVIVIAVKRLQIVKYYAQYVRLRAFKLLLGP